MCKDKKHGPASAYPMATRTELERVFSAVRVSHPSNRGPKTTNGNSTNNRPAFKCDNPTDKELERLSFGVFLQDAAQDVHFAARLVFSDVSS